MSGGAGFPLPRNAAAGLPARCLNSECGNTYQVPAEGPIRCPYCNGRRRYNDTPTQDEWPECVGCGELSPAGECPSCRNNRYREKAW